MLTQVAAAISYCATETVKHFVGSEASTVKVNMTNGWLPILQNIVLHNNAHSSGKKESAKYF